jgi:hypothetical protein
MEPPGTWVLFHVRRLSTGVQLCPTLSTTRRSADTESMVLGRPKLQTRGHLERPARHRDLAWRVQAWCHE